MSHNLRLKMSVEMSSFFDVTWRVSEFDLVTFPEKLRLCATFGTALRQPFHFDFFKWKNRIKSYQKLQNAEVIIVFALFIFRLYLHATSLQYTSVGSHIIVIVIIAIILYIKTLVQTGNCGQFIHFSTLKARQKMVIPSDLHIKSQQLAVCIISISGVCSLLATNSCVKYLFIVHHRKLHALMWKYIQVIVDNLCWLSQHRHPIEVIHYRYISLASNIIYSYLLSPHFWLRKFF